MKKYINAILTLSSVLVLFYTIYDQHKQIKEMEETMNNVQTESFQFHLMVDRYEMAVELFKEEDSVAAAKFVNILDNETE